jgi:beta-glucosidase
MTKADRLVFPQGFLWGTATSAYQIEGAASDDGRGPSIWDTFAHTPGKTLNGDTGDVASDHYHRYESDVALMQSLGLQSYRFSVSWPRVQPDGSGRANQAGLDFYRRLVGSLRDHGIEPLLTLYHWDLPQSLEDVGGWTNRETSDRFAEFANIVGLALGEDVDLWATLNEPFFAAFAGYELGRLAPGLTDTRAGVMAAHNMLLGHGKAVRALGACLPSRAQIGIALNLDLVRPATDGEADQAAAARVNDYLNRWFLDAALRGSYPQWLHDRFVETIGAEFVRPGDMDVIAAPIDFLGVNYYTVVRVEAVSAGGSGDVTAEKATRDPVFKRPYPPYLEAVATHLPDTERTGKGWEVYPEGLSEMLVWLHEEYDGLALYITENGTSFRDEVGPDGSVHDPARTEYLRAHFVAAHKALARGVNLRGYFVWSFLDNFEWADGYSERFGIVYVDFTTLERIPKSSALLVSEVAKQNSVSTKP